MDASSSSGEVSRLDDGEVQGACKTQKTCAVCGGQALGYNFGVISCEPCKAFFRRNASKGMEPCPVYRGRCAGDCNVNVENRQYCKHCRLKKCFAVGMKMKKALASLPSPSPSQQSDSSTDSSENEVLTPKELSIINNIVECLNPINSKKNTNPNASTYKDLVCMAEYSVRLHISFAKSIEQFKQLPKDDQVALLKGGMIELLILRSVGAFDVQSKVWVMKHEEEPRLTVVNAQKSLDDFSLEEYSHFVGSMVKLTNKDQDVLGLLSTVCLFSADRPQVVNRDKVEAAQQTYVSMLEKLLNIRFPGQQLFPKLVSKLCELRTQAENHSQRILKLGPNGINPLLLEVFDIDK